jgi:ABC-type phosphate transport system ATPase subunit
VFLFSRSIADNIAYGLVAHQERDQAAIEAAGRTYGAGAQVSPAVARRLSDGGGGTWGQIRW